MRRRVETAYHEAGHAVIGRVLTLDSGSATVKPDHDSGGHAITCGPWACIDAWEKRGRVRGPDAAWYAQIITCMAGAESVAELLRSAPRGDGDDRYQVALMAEELENWDRIEPRLRAMTCMLVRLHRALIERVAKALLDRTTLTRVELDALVGRSVDDVKVNAPFLLQMYRSREVG